MNPAQVDRAFVLPLVSLLVEGIDLGKLDAASRILSAVRLLRPQLANECFQFSVWILIKRGAFVDAARELNANANNTPQWHAMMSICLAAMNDPTWNSHADLVLEGDDEPSKALVRGLRREPAAPAAENGPTATVASSVASSGDSSGDSSISFTRI